MDNTPDDLLAPVGDNFKTLVPPERVFRCQS